jgi:class 3 adenylate cyclase/tetratricopeptide (TPR) repeat protein
MSDRVTRWLEEVGLGEHAESFAVNDIDFGLLTQLNTEDLKELGLSVGHRRRFLDAAAKLDKTASEDAGISSMSAPHGGAERRQLTVMFCDLVGSTELSQRLDPEDLREVNRAYQDACKAAIERYDGYVARYMGDGALAYFGFPQAHEDDAERAVHAGLDLVQAMNRLNADISKEQSVELQVRIGIATGPVVVGDLIGEGASQESAVVGETPNLAARLQALAAPNTVLIDPGAHTLAAGHFEYEDLGTHELKGIAEPVHAWRVAAPAAAESRFEASHMTGFTPLVGREHEVGLLLDRWEQVKEGDGQVVLLSGEAGIGKSRLAEALHERIASEEFIRMRYQCSAYQTNSALHPVIAQLTKAAQFDERDSPDVKLDKLESLLEQSTQDIDALASLIASLLSIPVEGRYAPFEMTPEMQKKKTLEALIGQIEGLSQHRPVLLFFEDVHWADPTTLELLTTMVDKAQGARALLLITFRPEFTSPWTGHTHVTALTLNRFSRSQVTTMMERLTGGKPLPVEVRDQIVKQTDGVPLFVEELTKAVLESEFITEQERAYVLTESPEPLALPLTLHDSLMSRLDRLGPVKEIAQIGAVIGREFEHKILAAAAPVPEHDLRDAMSQLIDAGLVFARGTTQGMGYKFKHALVRDAAYDSLLKRKRQELHGHIAKLLEDDLGQNAETAPEFIAYHYTKAQDHKRAIDFWELAGKHATARAASLEAINHFSEGLKLLNNWPDTVNRQRREVAFQINMAKSMYDVERLEDALEILGWAEPTAAENGFNLERSTIHHLCGACHDLLGNNDECMKQYKLSLRHARAARVADQEARALGGLGDAFYVRGRVITAHEYYDQCIEIGRRIDDASILAKYLQMRGVTWFFQNALSDASADLLASAEAAKKVTNRRAEMQATHCQGYVLYERGAFVEAVKIFERALDLARRIETRRYEPVSLLFLAEIAALAGRWSEASELAKEALAICRETGMLFLGPRALAKVALCTDDRKVAETALREGKDLLQGKEGICHNYLWFYRDAQEVCLRFREWDSVDRYADALEDYTRPEPFAWTEFVISRGRALAEYGRGNRETILMEEIRRLHDEANRIGLGRALPRLEEALSVR